MTMRETILNILQKYKKSSYSGLIKIGIEDGRCTQINECWPEDNKIYLEGDIYRAIKSIDFNNFFGCVYCVLEHGAEKSFAIQRVYKGAHLLSYINQLEEKP